MTQANRVDTSIVPIAFIIDGGGGLIPTGKKPSLEISYRCIIQSVKLLADQPGDLVIDIWKGTFAEYLFTAANSITAGAKPTLSNEIKYSDSVLTGWTTIISPGDILIFNVDSVVDITEVEISLTVKRV